MFARLVFTQCCCLSVFKTRYLFCVREPHIKFHGLGRDFTSVPCHYTRWCTRANSHQINCGPTSMIWR